MSQERPVATAWALAALFWRQAENRRSVPLLATIIVLNLALVGLTLLLTYWQRSFYNALEAREWGTFVDLLTTWRAPSKGGFVPGFLSLLAAYVLLTAYALYLRIIGPQLVVAWP